MREGGTMERMMTMARRLVKGRKGRRMVKEMSTELRARGRFSRFRSQGSSSSSTMRIKMRKVKMKKVKMRKKDREKEKSIEEQGD